MILLKPRYDPQVKDYVAYGEVDAATFETLLTTRGRVVGDAPLTDETSSRTRLFSSIVEFAGALAKGESKMRDIAGLKPVSGFTRLAGIQTTKRTYVQGGALGYYGPEINTLLYKMR
jgi:large subunit ribosomal protein L30